MIVLVPIIPICIFPENKSVYVQKIKAYVQKIEAFVLCLHKMEFVIYKGKMKNSVFTKNWDLTDFYKSKLSFLMEMLTDLTVIMNISIRADPLKCTLKDWKTWFSKFHYFLKIIGSGKMTGWFQNGFWYPQIIREAYLEWYYIMI